MWWSLLTVASAVDVAWYRDADGDGFGDGSDFVVATSDSASDIAGRVLNADDCNDASEAVSPSGQERCNAVDDDCDGAVDENGCLCSVRQFGDHGYGFCNVGFTWSSGRDTCRSVGHDLTTIDGPAENDWVASTARSFTNNNNARFWIGLNDREDEGQFVWQDGSTSSFRAFAPGEPNNSNSGSGSGGEDCIVTNFPSQSSTWNDANCGSFNPFVCEAEGDPAPWYRDADGDGFGTPDEEVFANVGPSGFVRSAADCDDDDASVHPGVVETCDDVDEDCDGQIDEAAVDLRVFHRDFDADTYGTGATVRACDRPDGYADRGGDCDDTRGSAYPGAPETCNDADDDCDVTVDEDATDATTWYTDADGDDYGVGAATTGCDRPTEAADVGGDCDDTRAAVYPGAPELADGLDNDCNGFDELHDSDEDGLTDLDEVVRATDPNDPDTDHDGLEDGDEVTRQTDPLDPDTDRDDRADGDEVVDGTDPLDADSDDDRLDDGDEYDRGTDPSNADTDGGGSPDGDEVDAGTDPLDPDDDRPVTSTRLWVPEEAGEAPGAGCSCQHGGSMSAFVWLAGLGLARRHGRRGSTGATSPR